MNDALFISGDRKSSGPAVLPASERLSPLRNGPGREPPGSWVFGQCKPAVVAEERSAVAQHGLHGGFAFTFRRLKTFSLWAALVLSGVSGFAQATNSAAISVTNSVASAATNAAAITAPLPSAMPDVLGSLGRVMLALAVVLGVFFAAVWLVRNWQRLVVHRGRTPRLNVLEVRSLGGRQALYVVGYDQERFLIASSPAGVNFLSHLQSADPAGDEPPGEKSEPQPSFAQALTKVLKGK